MSEGEAMTCEQCLGEMQLRSNIAFGLWVIVAVVLVFGITGFIRAHLRHRRALDRFKKAKL